MHFIKHIIIVTVISHFLSVCILGYKVLDYIEYFEPIFLIFRRFLVD